MAFPRDGSYTAPGFVWIRFASGRTYRLFRATARRDAPRDSLRSSVSGVDEKSKPSPHYIHNRPKPIRRASVLVPVSAGMPEDCSKFVDEASRRLQSGAATSGLFTPCVRHGEREQVILGTALGGSNVVVVTGDWADTLHALRGKVLVDSVSGAKAYTWNKLRIARGSREAHEGESSRPMVLILDFADMDGLMFLRHDERPLRVVVDGRTVPPSAVSATLHAAHLLLGPQARAGILLFASTLRPPAPGLEITNLTGEGALLVDALQTAPRLPVADDFSGPAKALVQKMMQIRDSEIGSPDADVIRARNAAAIAYAALTEWEIGEAQSLAARIGLPHLRERANQLIDLALEHLDSKRAEIRRLAAEHPEEMIILRDAYQVRKVFGTDRPSQLGTLDSPDVLLDRGAAILCCVPRSLPLAEMTTLRRFSIALREVEVEILGLVLRDGALLQSVEGVEEPERVILRVRYKDDRTVDHSFSSEQGVIRVSDRLAQVVPAIWIRVGETIAIPDPDLYEMMFRKLVAELEEQDSGLSAARAAVSQWKADGREALRIRFGFPTVGAGRSQDRIALDELEEAMQDAGARVTNPREVLRWLDGDADSGLLGPQVKEDARRLASILGASTLKAGADEYLAAVSRLRAHRSELGYDILRQLARLVPRGLAETPEGRALLEASPAGVVESRRAY